MINQLRLYRINPDLKDAFLARFRDHAARIMRERYGFKIVAMWLSDEPDNLRFVYILSWPDLPAKEEAWRRFMADEEWNEIKRVTRETSGEPVQGIEDILLNAVGFSAPLGVQG
ncbi:NIPSNAP family protein [Xanthobacter aminoxidans]|uniref:NIPSNAP family protein n=1 Tax=Xanthobacter aminoxidans TaxID=186280 RepID=UPI0037276103